MQFECTYRTGCNTKLVSFEQEFSVYNLRNKVFHGKETETPGAEKRAVEDVKARLLKK